MAVQSELPPEETPNPLGHVPFGAANCFLGYVSVACQLAKRAQAGSPARFRKLSLNIGFGGGQKIRHHGALFAFCLFAVASLMGCGKSSPALPNVLITISPSVVTLGLGREQLFTPTISGTTNSNVTWEVNGVTGGNSTYGTISSTGLYKAPAAVPNPSTLTVTAVSQANPADIANAAVTLTSDASVSVSPASANLPLGNAQQFAATVTGTANNAVTWQAGTVTGGNSTVGTISNTGLYTAPSTYSGTLPATVSVTAISAVDTTKSASASVTLHANMSVTVSPNTASVQTFDSLQFTATVQGGSNRGVTWEVNGVAGGSSITGTITSSGLYRAPHAVPTTSRSRSSVVTTVLVTAISQADATVSGSAVVTVFPPNQNQQNVPIPLGVSGGNATDSSATACCGATLGALVSRGGNQYILGSSHVLARDDSASRGESIIQPGLIDSSCSASTVTVVGSLSQFVNLENPGSTPLADAALAQVASGKVDPLGTILELGGNNNGNLPADGPPHGGAGVTPAEAVSSVHSGLVAKSGRSTGLTCSSIQAINVTAVVQYQKICGAGATFTSTFSNLIDIHDGTFSAEGDSGSLIVTRDTADPVALLLASSDTDTLGNSISDVLGALADQSTGERPLFVGPVNPHSVAACNLPGPQARMAAQRLALSNVAPSPEQLQRATNTRDLHSSELLSLPAVQALGVGPSLDSADESAILLIVKKGVGASNLPLVVDGVRTRIIEVKNSPEHAMLSAAESTALAPSPPSTPSMSALLEAELARARAVHAKRVGVLMGKTGVQGVGVTASADSPGDAALVIFLVRGVPHDSIPPVIDGLRTRIYESSRFRAGSGDKATRQMCAPYIRRSLP